MILVIDFGGQTAHLITRRLKELGVASKFLPPEHAMEFIAKEKPQGIILSGGPMSVYEKNAPTINKKIFSLGIPTLDICYGLQLRSYLLGGEVVSGTKEYGPVHLRINNHKSPITNGLPEHATVWMSHGDSVLLMPSNFTIVGSSDSVPYAFVVDDEHKQYGLQFHPEIEHTEIGMQVLKNFIEICGLSLRHPELVSGSSQEMLKRVQHDSLNPDLIIQKIKETVGENHVIGAISGGVDSSVAGALVAKAIGKQFTPIFVDNGLMRPDAESSVIDLFKKFKITPIVVKCEKEMLARLKNITDSEEKRKIIGNYYIEVFENELEKILKKTVVASKARHHKVRSTLGVKQSPKEIATSQAPRDDAAEVFLLQGTIYSDVIESQGTKHAAKIKSHHNVGGLPEHMKLKLLEPLRDLYKDEVRALGRMIGLEENFVMKQPFPGPGYAVRIRGEVTPKRLSQEKHADQIILEELKNAGILENIFISFPVMTDAYSTAVKGDGRFFGEVIALRVIESKDIMSSTWAKLPYELLQRISSRIVNEVPEISRVVYDISTKPPATMEWE